MKNDKASDETPAEKPAIQEKDADKKQNNPDTSGPPSKEDLDEFFRRKYPEWEEEPQF